MAFSYRDCAFYLRLLLGRRAVPSLLLILTIFAVLCTTFLYTQLIHDGALTPRLTYTSPHRSLQQEQIVRLQEQVERLESEQDMNLLIYATRLLSVLSEFSREEQRPSQDNAPHTSDTTRMGPTPESLLSNYYEKELTRRNNVFERKLDNGYVEHVLHSDTYWSPIHSVRRGYGLEGSIFVALLHHDTSTVASDDTACAMTVQNMYDAARWPIAVFTGIVEVVLDTTTAATEENKEKRRNKKRTYEWPQQPPSACIPRKYLKPSCMGSFAFCPRDNIRLRQVRVKGRPSPGKGETETHMHKDGDTHDGPSTSSTRTGRQERLFSSIAAQRYATLTLYRGETYVMFLRAGLLLRQHWDALTRLLWLQLPSHNAVLSQSPLRVNRATLRSAWNETVVENVKDIIRLTQQLQSGGGSSKTQKGGGLDDAEGTHERLKAVRWALREDLVPLDESQTAGNGLTEEDVLRYLFSTNPDPGGRASEGQPHNDDDSQSGVGANASRFGESGGVGEKKDNVTQAADTSRIGFRREVQLYWLRQYRGTLFPLVLRALGSQSVTPYLCSLHMRRGVDLQPQGEAKEDEAAENELLLKLSSVNTKRLSNALEDLQYIKPSSTHWCGETSGGACADARMIEKWKKEGQTPVSPLLQKDNTHRSNNNNNNNNNNNSNSNNGGLPYLLQPWVTTDFLFTRAEAFFDITQAKDRDTTADRNANANTAKSVPLDPYLSFLMPDEEAVLLSARLWTHGWDFFSPNEPVVFLSPQAEGDLFHRVPEMKSFPQRANTTAPTAKEGRERTTRMREESLIRLRFILFGTHQGTGRKANASLLETESEALQDVGRYGLGSHYTREDFFRFTGPASEKEVKDGSERHTRMKRYVAWCGDHEVS